MALIAFLFASAVAFSLPIILVVLLAGQRVSRPVAQGLIATSFAVVTAYNLWRMEWFDVWRHGTPSLTYLVGYVPWIAVMAFAGWLIASALLRGPRRAAPIC